MLWRYVNPNLFLIQLTQSDSPQPKKSLSMERGGEGFMALPYNRKSLLPVCLKDSTKL